MYVSNPKYFKQKPPSNYKPLPLKHINSKFVVKEIKKCIYAADFDVNETLYYIGTRLGSTKYKNPSEIKEVNV